MTTLKPCDAAELASLLRETTGPLEVVAGGSRRVVGQPFEASTLDVSALSGVLDYQPQELVLTALAGTPVFEIEALLLRHGQRLGFEPPAPAALLGGDAQATLGGTLMANASGSRRVTAGSARDHFLGFSAVSAEGEAFKAGGRVVKNVTGFDLPRLFAGSWGTLAVLTAATVRVVPVAETECTLLLPMTAPAHDVTRVVALCSKALGSSCDVSAAALLPALGLGLRLEGFERSVRARLGQLLSLLDSPDAQVLEQQASRAFWRSTGSVRDLAPYPVVWRVNLPPTLAPALLAAVQPEQFVLDWGGALLWLAGQGLTADRVRGALPSGHATLFKAPEAQRRREHVFQPSLPAVNALQSRLKASLDPRGRLNPGRMG